MRDKVYCRLRQQTSSQYLIITNESELKDFSEEKKTIKKTSSDCNRGLGV